MIEINDQSEPEEEKRPDALPQPPDSSETKVKLITKSKFWDFMLGFMAFGVIDGLITWVFSIDDHYGFGKVGAFIVIWIVNLIGIYYYSYRRRYFMFGIILLMIYPMLLFGSCFIK